MRAVTRSAAAALLASACGLWLLPAHAESDCDAYSQAERLTCLQQAAASSAQALQAAEKALEGAIGQWDDDAKYQAAARRRLADAGKAFAQYREAHCQLQKSLGGGAIGAGLEMRYQTCVAELNQQRGAQLQQFADRLPRR